MDKPITVCVPTLKRYDLLAKLLVSLQDGSVVPSAICIIDNGRRHEVLVRELAEADVMHRVAIKTPKVPLGVAASWNWFMRNVPEERIIVNDDVTFGRDSLQAMVETRGDIVSALRHTNACSCFLIRDTCIRKVGYFDERISPGYAYFEDCDYEIRMTAANVHFTGVDCGVVHGDEHGGSKTKEVYTPEEKASHDQRFQIARDNFRIKHGRLPHGMEGGVTV